MVFIRKPKNKDVRGIPDEIVNTVFLECQLRNFFNSQHNLPQEHSCYKTMNPQITEIKRQNFNGSCGIQTIEPSRSLIPFDEEKRIIHGTDANKGSWPWMASLRKSFSSDHYCGGVLISGTNENLKLSMIYHICISMISI